MDDLEHLFRTSEMLKSKMFDGLGIPPAEEASPGDARRCEGCRAPAEGVSLDDVPRGTAAEGVEQLRTRRVSPATQELMDTFANTKLEPVFEEDKEPVRAATDCSSCVFAVKDGGFQTGCRAGRLERYQSLGLAEPLPGGSFKIVGRICNLCRHAGSDWVEARDPADWLTLARLDARVRARAFVYVGAEATTAEVVAAVKLLAAQSLPPRTVEVVVNHDSVSYGALVRAVRDAGLAKWEVRRIEERTEDGSRVGGDRALDIAFGGRADDLANFAVVVEPGLDVGPDLLAVLDERVNDDLEVVAFEPGVGGGYHGLVVSLAVWRGLDGLSNVRDAVK